jgi:hypothetical protein
MLGRSLATGVTDGIKRDDDYRNQQNHQYRLYKGHGGVQTPNEKS